jgi:hypothetical protein
MPSIFIKSILRYSIILSGLTMCIKVHSQCSINSALITDGIRYHTTPERIYAKQNEDTFVSIHVFSELQITSTKNKGNQVEFFITISHTHTLPESYLVPRVLIIDLENSKSYSFIAQEYKNLDLGTSKLTSHSCRFKITLNDIEEITKSKTNKIVIKDPRIAKQISFKPYPSLIQEQLICCLNKLLENMDK